MSSGYRFYYRGRTRHSLRGGPRGGWQELNNQALGSCATRRMGCWGGFFRGNRGPDNSAPGRSLNAVRDALRIRKPRMCLSEEEALVCVVGNKEKRKGRVSSGLV